MAHINHVSKRRVLNPSSCNLQWGSKGINKDWIKMQLGEDIRGCQPRHKDCRWWWRYIIGMITTCQFLRYFCCYQPSPRMASASAGEWQRADAKMNKISSIKYESLSSCRQELRSNNISVHGRGQAFTLGLQCSGAAKQTQQQGESVNALQCAKRRRERRVRRERLRDREWRMKAGKEESEESTQSLDIWHSS